MNDSNAKTMYETVPAAAELNKVPGFDPLKFLRRTKDTLKLDLPYQKLWFRMAHPKGDVLAFAKEDPATGSIQQIVVATIDGKTLLPNVWYGVDLEKRMVS